MNSRRAHAKGVVLLIRQKAVPVSISFRGFPKKLRKDLGKYSETFFRTTMGTRKVKPDANLGSTLPQTLPPVTPVHFCQRHRYSHPEFF